MSLPVPQKEVLQSHERRCSHIAATNQDGDSLLSFVGSSTRRRKHWINRLKIHLRTRRNINWTLASYRESPVLCSTHDEIISWLWSENKARFDSTNTTHSSKSHIRGLTPDSSTVWGPQPVKSGDSRTNGAAPTFYSVHVLYTGSRQHSRCFLNDNVSSDILTYPLM